VEEILEGDVATLPLAPIERDPIGELPRVIQLMDDRIEREARPAERPELWTATFLLMGLIYPESLAVALLQGKSYMTESSTYQAILREGRAEGKAEGRTEEARRMLLLLGREYLGEPDPQIVATVEAMTDVGEIEELSKRLRIVASWDELTGGS
jgi:predicted transposase YdaD